MSFLEEMSRLTGRKLEEMTIEFVDFTEVVNRQYNNRLEGEDLEKRSETLFRQRCRSELKSDEASGVVPIRMYVTGISDAQDKIQWQRNKIVDLYKLNPENAIIEGKVNEYRSNLDGITKRSYDKKEQKIVETHMEELPKNAESVGSSVFVAPRDTQKTGFGGKENTNYGEELPRHKYSSYVFGFSEIENSDDVRWTKVMLRGDNALNHNLVINHVFTFKVINLTDKKSNEYNFIDTQKAFSAEDVDWELFDLEEVIQQKFVSSRKVELGNVENYYKTVENLKELNKFSDWNAAILVEADVSGIYPGQDGISDRLYVDDDTLRWNDSNDIQSNMNVWVSKHNHIDFGEYSRLLMTCYPSRGRPPKDSPDGTPGKVQLNAYGLYAFPKWKIDAKTE